MKRKSSDRSILRFRGLLWNRYSIPHLCPRFGGGAFVQFDGVFHGVPTGDRGQIIRLELVNRADGSTGVDEEQIQRDPRVLHVKAPVLLGAEDENHAVVR